MEDARKLFSDITVTEVKEMLIAAIQEASKGQKSIRKNDCSKDDELFTRQDIATLFSVTPETIDKWVRTGDFPAPLRQCGRTYFLRSEIDEFIKTKGGQYE